VIAPVRTRSHALAATLWAASVVAAVQGCRSERERAPGDGVHPAGFAVEESADFHGTHLRDLGYPLASCRDCHGDDYLGGRVGSSCVSSNCHGEGVESCDTCHDAQPESGAHAAHGQDCASCHPVRVDARSEGHPGGEVEIAFGELARANGAAPTHVEGSCAGVYCHGERTQSWEGEPLDCGGCHENPPPSHARFAGPDQGCDACHGTEATHLDGRFDQRELACDACHGAGPLGAPPRGLDGTTAGGAVGAHRRHLDPTLLDRIGRVARCQDCHVVPSSTTADGHLDPSAPADVQLRTGDAYDPALRSCTSDCHWDRAPGPVWDDASGAARACDGCHGMPPEKTRIGGPHPPSSPSLCGDCHPFDPLAHVDGKVDFTW
jgi:predicted CxxxxCH...CXXCH cytochrome family protein